MSTGHSSAASCTVKGKKSPWLPVIVERPLPDDVAVEFRTDYGKAFNECLNDIYVRLRNDGPRIKTIDLGRCQVGDQWVSAPHLTAAPGKKGPAYLTTVKLADVPSLRCDGGILGRAKNSKPLAERELLAEYVVPVPNSDNREMRKLTGLIVDHFLEAGFRYNHLEKIPLSYRIQYGLRLTTNLREKEGMSTNLQLRNAEYYLHGLYAEVSGDREHLRKTYEAAEYDAIKGIVQGTIVGYLIRSNWDNPTSPPGGAPWAALGIKEGKHLKHLKDVEFDGRIEGHGLDLKELYRVVHRPKVLPSQDAGPSSKSTISGPSSGEDGQTLQGSRSAR